VHIDQGKPSIDILLESIRSEIMPIFTKKWSNHEHVKVLPQNRTHEPCNLTLTMDGNWKLGRMKCIYADNDTMIASNEFGPVQTGCRAAPEPRSYYCKQHSEHEIKFRFYTNLVSINPNLIKCQKLSNIIHINRHIVFLIFVIIDLNENVLVIHDSYIDRNEKELFYVETDKAIKWLDAQQLPKKMVCSFYERQHNNAGHATCNTVKKFITSCDIKCKTRGILLCATNCGVVVSYRELYGAESHSQVAMLYLDTLDYFKGNFD